MLRWVLLSGILLAGIVWGGLGPPSVSAQVGTGTIRVAPTGTDGVNCGSAAAPCQTVQYAINVAMSGDTIKLAQGTYVGTGSAVASLSYASAPGKNLTFIGGFAPPDWTNASTDPTKTIIDGQNARQGFSILSVPAITVNIQGLTIQNGYDSTPAPFWGENTGGGLVCLNTNTGTTQFVSLYVTNVILQNNHVQGLGNLPASGGGMSLYLHCRGVLTDVIFNGNTVVGGNAPDGTRGGMALGGGLFATEQSDVTALRVTFTNNSATGGSGGSGIGSNGWTADALGGGAALQLNTVSISHVTANNNRVQGGSGSQKGGLGAGSGLFFEKSTAWVQDGYFKGNVATGGNSPSLGGVGGGGGIFADDTTLNLERLTIVNNSSVGGTGSDGGAAGGGGMYLTRESTAYASSTTGTNLIVGGNTAQAGAGNNRYGGGGGIFNQNSALTLTHATIAQNSELSTMQGPAIVSLNYFGSSSVTLYYSIVASHAGPGAAIIIQQAGDVGNFNYTLFYNNLGGKYSCQPGMSGCAITNSNEAASGDPAFVSPGAPNFDYHIGSSSAAKDKAFGSTTALDIDSHQRPFNFVSDIGAHEFGASPPPPPPPPVPSTVFAPFIAK